MLDNEYLMQHYVRDRLHEARAIAAAATVARQANTETAPAADDITCTSGRALDMRKVVASRSPHLLVLPEYQGRGVGRAIVDRLRARYAGYHQHVLIADGRTVDFYRKCGFERAGRTEPMWIYAGADH